MIFPHYSLYLTLISLSRAYKFLDICGQHNSRKLYVEYGTSGDLLADSNNTMSDGTQKKCSVELITCPSCVIDIKFKFLNISRTCKTTTQSGQCSCDYILLYEPAFGVEAGQQYCGKFVQNNVSELVYYSKTRVTNVQFIYTDGDYGHGFTLEFSAKKNQIIYDGYPRVSNMNNASQTITSPFFPHLYPSDLSSEYVIKCHSKIPCRISLLFSDFLMADSSILEFFDWNGQRLYVISGSTFRPPAIATSGPSLIIRFYANGASDLGFKASYSFTLGNMNDMAVRTNTDCGGQVNNLGGGITMMNMVAEGTTYYDCVWIVKTPNNFLHRKTHLYVKVANFSNFAGTTALSLRKGITSNENVVELLKYPVNQFNSATEKEHVVTIKEGFYIRLTGMFKPQSRLAIVYAAFNYKDCFSGLDYLCQNMRCISALLNCDGFDHCGDNSDESAECSQDPKDHREFSKIPNFLFPKVEPYADLTVATFVFLLCSFGLIGIIFAMALLLYRVNIRARHQRQIQDHIETIHAILEEGVGDVEEELIVPDEPPDYEPPPEYSDVLNYIRRVACGHRQKCKSQNTSKLVPSSSLIVPSTSAKSYSPEGSEEACLATTSKSCQTSPFKVPDSPPPLYDDLHGNDASFSFKASIERTSASCSSRLAEVASINEKISCFPKKVFIDIGVSLRENIRKCKSTIIKTSKKRFTFSDGDLVRYFSDSELIHQMKNDRRNGAKLKNRSFSTSDLFG